MGPNLTLALPGAAAPRLLPGFPSCSFPFCPFPAPRCWHEEDGQCHPGAVGSVLPAAPLWCPAAPPRSPSALVPGQTPALSRGRVLRSRGSSRGQDQTLLSTGHCHELGTEPCGVPPAAWRCLPAGARLLVPSHPASSHPVPPLTRGPPIARTTDTARGRSVPSTPAPARAGRGAGDTPGGVHPHPPPRTPLARGRAPTPGVRGRVRAAAGSEPMHTARGSCPALRPSLGTTEPLSLLVVCFICKLLARHSRGAQRPCLRRVLGDTGAAAVPGDIPRRAVRGTQRAGLRCPQTAAPPPVPVVPALGSPAPCRGLGDTGDTEQRPDPARLPASEEAPNPCGLPGKPRPRGRWGRAASLGASTRCWEPWGAGACPGSPQTTQKTEGRSRLTHGRALGAEISRPSAALTSLPQPVPAALVWVSASSLGAKAPGPGLGREEEGGRKPPAPCAANTGTRQSPGQALAVPLHPSRRQGAAQS